MRVLFIDNFDSFTYNLVDEFEKRDCEVMVYRNNIDMRVIDNAVKKFNPDLIVISPGPSTPSEAGNSVEIIKEYFDKLPILGICLGHQCIIKSFGGMVGKAPEIVHGKPSKITHDGLGIYKNIDSPFQAGRYHSLTGIDVPYCLEISARSENGIVMSIRHKEYPIIGLQYHPESILTPLGGKLIENMMDLINNKGSKK